MSFLVYVIDNALPALMVTLYLAYEIHFGRLDDLAGKIDALIDAVVALARESPAIDEDKVAERLNGDSPDDLIVPENERDDGDPLEDYYAQD